MPSWIILKDYWEPFAFLHFASCSGAQGNNHCIFFLWETFIGSRCTKHHVNLFKRKQKWILLCAEFCTIEFGQYKLYYFNSLQEICHLCNILSRFNKSFCIMLFKNAFLLISKIIITVPDFPTAFTLLRSVAFRRNNCPSVSSVMLKMP